MLVALDLGGVIADVDHTNVDRALGIDAAARERAFFDGGLHDGLTVGAVDGETFARAAAERLALPPAQVRAAWALVVNVTTAGRALVDELLACGATVHLWSNTDPIHLERMRAQLPAGVGARTASYVLGAMKPQPAFYARARALGEPAVFLDDLEANVAAAHAAGVTARVCRGAAEARAILVSLGIVPAR